MAAITDHCCFQPPNNRAIAVWRYLDFTKFVFLLDTRSLFFARSDRFDDPYEGSVSHANSKLRPLVYGDRHLPPQALEQMSRFQQWVRQWTFISCWHMNEFESAAMWKLYTAAEGAVAIKSTFQRLVECLPDTCYSGMVRYIDYEHEWLPEGNSFWPFVHKRKSFEHEREIRAVIQELPVDGDKIDYSCSSIEGGKLIHIDPEALIQSVYVSPTAPLWFADLVTRVVVRYGFQFPVVQSLLAKEPVF